MNTSARTILSSVILNHGNRLLTSNAFCKVYLTGYLVDYPKEKHLLISIKEQELPKAFLDFKDAKITEADLQSLIMSTCENSAINNDVFAWGVDAWAAAVGLSGTIRLNILKQCFDHSDPVLNFTVSTPKNHTNKQTNAPVKRPRFAHKAFVTASLAIVIWMIPTQESDNFASIEKQTPRTQQRLLTATPKVKPKAAAIAMTTRISAAEMLDQTLSKLKDKKSPQPMSLVRKKTLTQKTKQLRADIDAYLQSGQKSD